VRKILVVDDLFSVRAYIRQLLQHDDFEIIEACNGLDALKKISHDPPDLIITDIIMPEMEGLEMIKRVRTQNRDIPIIAMTASKHAIYLKMAQRFGADSGLEKPFNRPQLLSHIRNALSDDNR